MASLLPVIPRPWLRVLFYLVQGWMVGILISSTALAANSVAVRQQQDAVCTRCHDDTEAKPILAIYQTRHGKHGDGRTPTCQQCHGESKAHVDANPKSQQRPLTEIRFSSLRQSPSQPGTPAIGPQNDTCLSCHPANQTRHWSGSRHQSEGLTCATCHTLHSAQDPVRQKTQQPSVCFSCHKTERAETRRISSHPISAGKMACSDCHNPHGSLSNKLLHTLNSNDTCYRCHAEKRGPFLWEHPPASDDCLTCHSPHGSTHTPLLKARSPWLCQECHSGTNHPGKAYSATTGTNNSLSASVNNTPQLAYRGCLNCHTQVHGSNHPAGVRLLR